jgi:hypothetical protein
LDWARGKEAQFRSDVSLDVFHYSGQPQLKMGDLYSDTGENPEYNICSKTTDYSLERFIIIPHFKTEISKIGFPTFSLN